MEKGRQRQRRRKTARGLYAFASGPYRIRHRVSGPFPIVPVVLKRVLKVGRWLLRYGDRDLTPVPRPS